MPKRPTNIFVWGFSHQSLYPVIDALKSQPGLNLLASIHDRSDATIRIDKLFDFCPEYDPATTNVGDKLYEKLYANLYWYIDQMSRHDQGGYHKDFHDYIHIFNSQIYYFVDLLKSRQVEVAIFSGVPHEGADLLLYLIARELGIKTVCLYVSQFPNRFFYQLEIGTFHMDYPELWGRQYLEVIDRQENLFYMKAGLVPKYRLKELWQECLGSLGRRHKYYVSLNGLVDLHRYFRKYANYQRFYKNQKKLTAAQVNMDVPFIYFPLHLQPELTTSALGGVYVDQLLAIEQLSRLIPADWKIYVKENPKQGEFMRGPYFYRRLAKIPKVVLVPVTTNTFELIKHSGGVATITGTPGFEALKLGKKVIAFGQAWFRDMHGVFLYDESFKWADFASFSLDLVKVDKDIQDLVYKLPLGVVISDYTAMVPGFDPQKNAESITDFIVKLIQRLDSEGPAVV